MHQTLVSEVSGHFCEYRIYVLQASQLQSLIRGVFQDVYRASLGGLIYKDYRITNVLVEAQF